MKPCAPASSVFLFWSLNMLFLANVKYACSFTDSSFHFIFSLLEKLIWCTDNNKGCQTTVVVTAKLKRNNKRKPTSYFTVSLCDIPPMKNSAHGLIRGDKQEQFFNGKNCHMTFQIKFKKKIKKVKLQKTFCILKIKKIKNFKKKMTKKFAIIES